MKKLLLLTAISLGLHVSISAQTGLEFNNRHLAQSAYLNPAFMPQYKFSMGFGSGLQAYHPGFNINTFYNSATDAPTTIRNIINDPNVNLNMSLDSRTEIFNAGFKSKNSYLGFNLSNQSMGQLNIPKDLLGIAMFGNQEYYGKRANFDFSGTEFINYNEAKFSYGRSFGNKLNLGVSYSMINGIAHANLKTAYGYLETDTNINTIYQLKMGGAFDAQTSLMGLNVMKAVNDSTYDAEQVIADGILADPLGFNKGSALGFGFVYRANSHWRVSGSMNNIGKIIWDMGAESHKMTDKPWTFTGLDTSVTNDLKNVKVQDVLLDSMSTAFENQSTKLASYETKLHQRYTIGIEYFFKPRSYIQFAYGAGFGVKGDKSFARVNLHKELGEWVDLRLSYSLYDFNQAQHNVGVGVSLNLGPIQPWISINNISGLTAYDQSHFQSMRFGLNINIGTRKDSDGDGVRDKSDSCHLTFGARSNNGCELGYLGGKMNYDDIDTDSVMADPIIVPSAVETTPAAEERKPSDSQTLTEKQNEPVISVVEPKSISGEDMESTTPKTSKKSKAAKPKKKAKAPISLTESMMN
ncbi:MAG: DUF5723 family protein [Bacteroidota bacterium]